MEIGTIVRAPLLPERGNYNNNNTAKRHQRRRRAVIATKEVVRVVVDADTTNNLKHDDDGATTTKTRTKCILLYENEIPKLNYITNIQYYINRFIIVPNYFLHNTTGNDGTDEDTDNIEDTVFIEDLQPLYDFESSTTQQEEDDDRIKTDTQQDSSSNSSSSSTELSDVLLWKERGDILLRNGDVTVAAVCYEVALQYLCCLRHRNTNHKKRSQSDKLSISIGDTVVIKYEGYIHIVEIDCINNNDNENDDDDTNINKNNNKKARTTYDVTIVKTFKEITIPYNVILFHVITTTTTTTKDHIQERILLNLSRCLLQLSQITTVSDRKISYTKSAILASTIVIELSNYYSTNEQQQQQQSSSSGNTNTTTNTTNNNNEITALLLRSQAYHIMGKTKYNHAIADIKRILVKFDPNHTEATKLYKQYQMEYKQQQLADKKLSKNVSQWIQSTLLLDTNQQQEQQQGTPITTITTTTKSLQKQPNNDLVSFYFMDVSKEV